MRVLRGVGRLLFALMHLLGGYCTVRFCFGRWSVARRHQAVQVWSTKLLASLGVRLCPTGQVPTEGPLLLACNHLSWLDILVLHAQVPCCFIAKAELHRWPVVGAMSAAAGTIFIERESRRDAMRVAHHMAASLGEGHILAIFPEGTTSHGGSVLPFHANLLQAAIAANAPVQVLALTYLDAKTQQPSRIPHFVGEEFILVSVWRTLCAIGLTASVRWGGTSHHAGRNRRAWAADLHQQISQLHFLTQSQA